MTEWKWIAIWILWWVWVAEILEYFSISWEWLIIMTVMLVLDLIFWLLSTKSRWEQIESKKLQEWLIKKMTRRLLPFIVAMWLKRTWMPWINWLTSVIVWMIIFSELYSIIWHIYSINYKEQLPEVDAFKMLLQWLVKLLRNLIKKENEKLDTEEQENSLEICWFDFYFVVKYDRILAIQNMQNIHEKKIKENYFSI